MKIKVCGLKDLENIAAVAELGPDYLGFIFYPGSPRCVANLNAVLLANLDGAIKKIGVFVDAPATVVARTVTKYFLNGVQLHGCETVEYCSALRQVLPGLEIFKAFPVGPGFNFNRVKPFEEVCDCFVFDTAPTSPGGSVGGSGTCFPWELLPQYQGKVPFLLSGGIGVENIRAAKKIVAAHPQGVGVDVNSRVEISPGVKSLTLAKQIITEVRS